MIPILIVMILVGLVRHYITMMITSAPKPQAPDVVRQQRILSRAATLRTNGFLLPHTAFRGRLDWLVDVLDRGVYIKPEEPKKVSEQKQTVHVAEEADQQDSPARRIFRRTPFRIPHRWIR